MRAQLPPKPGSFVSVPALDTERDRILAHGGQLIPPWRTDCITCHGRRWFRWYADPAAPRETAEVIEYDCPCLEQVETAWFLQAAGMHQRVGRYVWGDTQFTDPRDVEAIREYREDLLANLEFGRGLFLHGPDSGVKNHGNGKTLHAVLMLKQALAAGMTGYYATWQDLVKRYTEGWRDKDAQRWFSRKVAASRVLVIDDIGMENENYTKSTARAAMDDLFRARMDSGLPTLITTNLGHTEFLRRYESAVTSLVQMGCEAIEFVGPDFRAVRVSQADVERLGLTGNDSVAEARTNISEQSKLEIKRRITRPWLFG